MPSIADSRKRKRGRPSTGIGPAIGLRLYPELEHKLKAWIKAQSDRPSKPEAIRRLVEIGLTAAPQRPASAKSKAKAADMAGEAIDKVANTSAPAEERANRKRQLVKGPAEFREMRDDQAKRRK